jgi:hypothetical protein
MAKPCPLFSVPFIIKICNKVAVTHAFGNMAFFEKCLCKLASGDSFTIRVTYRSTEDRHIHETLLRQLVWFFEDKVYFTTSPAIPTNEVEQFICFWTFKPRHNIAAQIAA